MKRAVLLADVVYPNGSGAEYANYLLAKELASRGYKVYVIYDPKLNTHSPHDTKIPIPGGEIIHIPMHLIPSPITYPSCTAHLLSLYIGSSLLDKLLRILNSSDIVIIGHYCYGILQYKERLKAPVIALIHDYFPLCPRSTLFNYYNYYKGNTNLCQGAFHEDCAKCYSSYIRFLNSRLLSNKAMKNVANSLDRLLRLPYYQWCKRLFERKIRLLSVADKIVFVSQDLKNITLNIVKNNFPDEYQILERKSNICYNPLPKITLQYYKKTQKDHDGNFIILHNGGLILEKGFHLVMSSAIQLASILNVREKSISYRSRIHFIITKAKVRYKAYIGQYINVELLPHLDLKSYNNLLNNTHILVYPSLWHEPFGYSILDAILRKIPIVATSHIGVLEIIGKANINNYIQLVDVSSYDIVSKILETLDHYDSALQKAERALAKLLHFYNKCWPKMFTKSFEIEE